MDPGIAATSETMLVNKEVTSVAADMASAVARADVTGATIEDIVGSKIDVASEKTLVRTQAGSVAAEMMSEAVAKTGDTGVAMTTAVISDVKILSTEVRGGSIGVMTGDTVGSSIEVTPGMMLVSTEVPSGKIDVANVMSTPLATSDVKILTTEVGRAGVDTKVATGGNAESRTEEASEMTLVKRLVASVTAELTSEGTGSRIDVLGIEVTI